MARTAQYHVVKAKPPPPPTQFPSPFGLVELRPLMTLVELRMRKLSGRIRDKPRWWEEMHVKVVAKWREELEEHDRANVEELWGGDKAAFTHLPGYSSSIVKLWPRDPVTEEQLNYIFDELKHDAECYDGDTGIIVSTRV